jgi:hypothetical protein
LNFGKTSIFIAPGFVCFEYVRERNPESPVINLTNLNYNRKDAALCTVRYKTVVQLSAQNSTPSAPVTLRQSPSDVKPKEVFTVQSCCNVYTSQNITLYYYVPSRGLLQPCLCRQSNPGPLRLYTFQTTVECSPSTFP